MADPASHTTEVPDWECHGCGKSYADPVNVPVRCPDCGEYADDEPE